MLASSMKPMSDLPASTISEMQFYRQRGLWACRQCAQFRQYHSQTPLFFLAILVLEKWQCCFIFSLQYDRGCTVLPLKVHLKVMPSSINPLSSGILLSINVVFQCPSKQKRNIMVLRVDGNDLPTSSADQQDAIKAVHQDFQELHI